MTTTIFVITILPKLPYLPLSFSSAPALPCMPHLGRLDIHLSTGRMLILLEYHKTVKRIIIETNKSIIRLLLKVIQSRTPLNLPGI